MPEGEILFREGDTPEDVFLVVSGRVGLDINAPGMGSRRIMKVGPGEIFGWSAIFEQTQMTATAVTFVPAQWPRLIPPNCSASASEIHDSGMNCCVERRLHSPRDSVRRGTSYWIRSVRKCRPECR